MSKIFKAFYLILLLVVPNTLYAQMFSISERKEKENMSNNYIRIGTVITDFKYVGDLNEADQELLEVKKPILGVSVKAGVLTTEVAYGNSLLGIKDGKFINVNLMVKQDLTIVRKRKLKFGFPIELNGGMTSSSNDFSSNSFNQNYYSAGSGIFINISPKMKIDIKNHLIFGYGLSNNRSGFFGGSINYIKGGARIDFINIMYERNLSLEYNYIFRSFDVDGEVYDYKYKGHSITIGISL